MKVCALASGSSGNSLYVETEHAKILVDAGISLRQINRRLNKLNVDVSEIDAVIITHEHSDHTAAVSKVPIPVYVASATSHLWCEKVNELKEFESDSSFAIKDLTITPFSVPHDSLDPVGFTIETENYKKTGIVTDIGSVTELVKERLKGSNILIIEFNHDDEMLRSSHYPWDIKQRIKGRLGHLSNDQASELLESLLHNRLSHVILAHLSEVNNSLEAAFQSASKAVKKWETGLDVNIVVAPKKKISEVVKI